MTYFLERDHHGVAEAPCHGDEPARGRNVSPDASPLYVRSIERTALIRWLGADILFGDGAVRAVADGLDRLVTEGGHTRLLLNLSGVRYLSGDLLGRLARIRQEVEPGCGHVRLCGVEPVVRDMLAVTGWDRILDVCNDEADGLGLVIR